MERREDGARCHRIDPNAVADHLLGEAAGEVADEGFCGGIEHGTVAAAITRSDRRGVDDGAALPPQPGDGRARCRHHRQGVQIQNVPDMIVGRLHDRNASQHAAAIVDEAVEAAEMLAGAGDDLRRGRGISEVPANQE